MLLGNWTAAIAMMRTAAAAHFYGRLSADLLGILNALHVLTYLTLQTTCDAGVVTNPILQKR